MNGDAIEIVVASVSSEAAEDYVGLWSVVRHLRRYLPHATDAALQSSLRDVIRRLMSSGCAFGQFVDNVGFVVWPGDQIVEQVLDALASLGRDPDIGEVGWFVGPPEAAL
jgi:hypothetical protein